MTFLKFQVLTAQSSLVTKFSTYDYYVSNPCLYVYFGLYFSLFRSLGQKFSQPSFQAADRTAHSIRYITNYSAFYQTVPFGHG